MWILVPEQMLVAFSSHYGHKQNEIKLYNYADKYTNLQTHEMQLA